VCSQRAIDDIAEFFSERFGHKLEVLFIFKQAHVDKQILHSEWSPKNMSLRPWRMCFDKLRRHQFKYGVHRKLLQVLSCVDSSFLQGLI
jgi:hypothetical protein